METERKLSYTRMPENKERIVKEEEECQESKEKSGNGKRLDPTPQERGGLGWVLNGRFFWGGESWKEEKNQK